MMASSHDQTRFTSLPNNQLYLLMGFFFVVEIDEKQGVLWGKMGVLRACWCPF
jgi:hypothetical protein